MSSNSQYSASTSPKTGKNNGSQDDTGKASSYYCMLKEIRKDTLFGFLLACIQIPLANSLEQSALV